jgi:toxin YoeB
MARKNSITGNEATRASGMRIKALLRDAREHPFTGIGKPEPLKHDLSGCWSRRITKEHRLVYSLEGDVLIVHQCRFHYAR